ncbi:MAG: hypothetical protein HY675_05065 [Chloroflexi bacterium]|nr:hypothetical protein [Chloroflexota bacterium]
MKTCLNWKVLAGLAVAAVGIYAFAPNFGLGALPLLLLAACPLSMLLMMWFMGKGMGGGQCEQQGQQVPKAAGTALTREEQLRQLKEQLLMVQAQQAALAAQIKTLDQAEPPQSTSNDDGSGEAPQGLPVAAAISSGDDGETSLARN